MPDAALRLAFGSVLRGAGQVWADDLTLEVVDPKEIKSTQPAPPERNYADHASNLDFEATGADAANPVPGWSLHGHLPEAYSNALPKRGPMAAGRSWRSIRRNRGHRRFSSQHRISPEAPTMESGCGSGRTSRPRAWPRKPTCRWDCRRSSQRAFRQHEEPGSKGMTDWQSQDVVVDVPADAEGLSIGVVLRGVGKIGVDDASVEIVDPSKVPLTTEP